MTDLTPSVTTAEPAVQTQSGCAERRRAATGLYDPRREHDACGVGFIAHMKGVKSHQIIRDGLAMLENLTHRGAVGADPLMGDGAGLLVQIPDRFFREETGEAGHHAAAARPLRRRLSVHAAGRRAARPYRRHHRRGSAGRGRRRCSASATCRSTIRRCRRRRTSPHPSRSTGRCSSAAAADIATEDEFERRLYILRKVISARIHAETNGVDNGFYTVSMSARTIVYKGMFLAYQVARLLQGPRRPALRERAGAGPPALLDQHLPVVEAGASLSHGRPQRRDQHAARQRQLDGGAAGVGRVRRCSATTSRSCGRSPMRASRTPPASTTRSNSCGRAAIR